MKVNGFGIYICNLCDTAFMIHEDHEMVITGIMKNSNGRHIVKEYYRNSKKHICFNCIDSIRSDECNFSKLNKQ